MVAFFITWTVYDPSVQTGDNVIVYYNTSTGQDSGALNITNWGTVSNGIRIAQNNVVISNSLYANSSMTSPNVSCTNSSF